MGRARRNARASPFNRMADNLQTAGTRFVIEREAHSDLAGQIQRVQKLAALARLASEVAT